MKGVLVFFAALLCLLAAGCNRYDLPKGNSSSQAQDVAPDVQEDIIDLTRLSSTMVYAEVYAMMAAPETYVGKTIKMSGPYYASPNLEKGIYYHFVLIEDATGCCSQGLEFMMEGTAYPDDYPADDTMVEVTGVWGTYYEDGQMYYYINAVDISVLA